jgi:hypothetical protein
VISLWDCVDQSNVKWKVVDAGEGWFYLQAKHSEN